MQVIIAIRKLVLGQKPQFWEFQQSELSHLSQYTRDREEWLWKAKEENSLMLHLGGEQRKQSRDSETVRINMSFLRERIRAEGKRFA